VSGIFRLSAVLCGMFAKSGRRSEMAIKFNDAPYVTEHGRDPMGRGCWGFSDEYDPPAEKMVSSPAMTLTDAKKWYRSKLAEQGIKDVEIYILP